MVNSKDTCWKWYNKSYLTEGFKAQRLYPNEELCRFMGREFFSIPYNKRDKITILDVGCGSCSNLWMIAREGFKGYGIDLSEEAIKLGKLMLEKWNANAELKTGNMCQLPYESEFFDAILDIFSSNCLNEEDFERYISEVIRVMKSGGKYFSYSPSTNSDAFKNFYPSKKIDATTLDGIKRKTSPYYGNDYPFRFIDPLKYKKILEDNGLKVIYLEVVSRTYRFLEEKFEFVTIVGQKST